MYHQCEQKVKVFKTNPNLSLVLRERITLDRKTFDVLSSGLRIEILKKLDERAKTVSELSREINFYKSAVHRHLSKLVESGLVERKEGSNKWVYYCLTKKGRRILHPQKTEIAILLSTAILSILGGIVGAYYYIRGKVIEIAGNAHTSGSQGEIFVQEPTLLYISIFLLTIGIAIIVFTLLKEGRRRSLLLSAEEISRDIYDEWLFSREG